MSTAYHIERVTVSLYTTHYVTEINRSELEGLQSLWQTVSDSGL